MGAITTGITSRRSVLRSRETASASRRTVLIALLANLFVLAAKLAGAVLSGSAALFAEVGHSLADTINQGFLLHSIGLTTREPTPDQPFGFGRTRFVWTFVAAAATFLAGAFFAVGMGVYEIVRHLHSGDVIAAYVPLGVSLVAEGSSLLRAVRQTRAEADEAGLSLLRYVRFSRDPNTKMVLFEDTAAMIGVVVALAGILIDQFTGLSIFDPLASIVIGMVLVGVSAVMAHDVSSLLVGSAARPDERDAILSALQEFEEIDDVLEVLTMVLGANSLLVAARVDLARGLNDDRVEELSERVDQRLREVVPDVTEVFVDPTPRRARRPAQSRPAS